MAVPPRAQYSLAARGRSAYLPPRSTPDHRASNPFLRRPVPAERFGFWRQGVGHLSLNIARRGLCPARCASPIGFGRSHKDQGVQSIFSGSRHVTVAGGREAEERVPGETRTGSSPERVPP
jgi:hypothetical protein